MDLFEYISLMKEKNTPFAIAGVVILCLFLLVIIFKMLGGMRRGTWRQLLRTGLTVLAAVASYIVAIILSNSIIGSTENNIKTIENLIPMIEGYIPGIGDIIRNVLLSFDTELFDQVILLPATVIFIPVVATLAFLVINLVLKIVRAIIVKIFKFKKAKKNSQRLGGALLAVIEAVIWIIMVTLPITGMLTLVDRAYDESVGSRRSDNAAEITEFFDEYIDPFTENPAFTFIESFGCASLADGIATVDIEGEKVNLRNETVSITKVIIFEIPMLEGIDFSNLNEENKVGINNLINGLCESRYMSNLFVGTLQSASSVLNLDIFSSITEEGEFSGFFSSLIDYLESVNTDTLHEDLDTIKNLFYSLSDSGVLKELMNGNTDIIGMLQEQHKAGDNTINELVSILQGNARTASLVKSVTESLISSLVNVDLGNGVTVTYDTLKESMNDVLSVKAENYESEDEYMEALSGTLNETLNEHGIELEKEVVDSIAEFIDDKELNTEEFTDQDFTDVLLHYYDAYLEYLNSSEGGEGLPEELPEGIPEDILDILPGGAEDKN